MLLLEQQLPAGKSAVFNKWWSLYQRVDVSSPTSKIELLVKNNRQINDSEFTWMIQIVDVASFRILLQTAIFVIEPLNSSQSLFKYYNITLLLLVFICKLGGI